LIEYGSPKETLDLALQFPYPKQIIQRNKRYGASRNAIDGFRDVLGTTSDFITHFEEDILMHHSFLSLLQKQTFIFREQDTAYLLTDIADKEAEENFGIYESTIPRYRWGAVFSKQFVEYFLSEKFSFTNDGMHIVYPRLCRSPIGGDRYIEFLVGLGGWKIYLTYMSRLLNIGMYGYHFIPKGVPRLSSYQEKIDWLGERIRLGDFWQYSETMKNSDIPSFMCRFNPCLG
jgi:hypothetical protein